MNDVKCVVCEKIMGKDKFISIFRTDKWGTVTKRCCEPCYQTTKQKWIENDWELLDE